MKLLVNEFLAQAEAHPDRPAVMDCYGTDTYGCLNRRSAILATRLLDGVQGQRTRAVSTENVILKAAIKKAVLAVASADCDEWFACTGYCQ